MVMVMGMRRPANGERGEKLLHELVLNRKGRPSLHGKINMDPSQKIILEQANEIIKNANAQSWSAGLVALVFLIMVGVAVVMLKWFLNSKSKTDADSLARERDLGAKIDKIDDFTRTTLTDLQVKSTAAMNNVARAVEGCLAKQRDVQFRRTDNG
jgi:hypothetical protein